MTDAQQKMGVRQNSNANLCQPLLCSGHTTGRLWYAAQPVSAAEMSWKSTVS